MHQLFRWLEHTSFSVFIRHSTWGFAIIEMVHLLGLSALGGAVVVVDLRLFGVGLRRTATSRIAKELWPVLLWSLAVMLVSGMLLVSTGPMKYYYSPAFRLKMLFFPLAIASSLILHVALFKTSPESAPTRWQKSLALVSLILWLAVGLAGRAIGFFG